MINHYFFIFTAPPEDVSDICGSHAYSQVVEKDEVEIVCIPLNILVRSLTEALTQADFLDLIQDNGEVDPEIAAGRVPSPTIYDGRRRSTRCPRQGGWECNGKYMC